MDRHVMTRMLAGTFGSILSGSIPCSSSTLELLVVPLASLLLLTPVPPLTLLWPVLWLLRVSFILPLTLRSILLALRLWRRLFMLDYRWLWLLLTLPQLRLRSLLLIVLPHYGLLRLITVLLPVQRLLLLHSGISIP